jgi:hypothetical protein
VFDLSGDSFQFHLRVPAKKLTAQYYAAAATRTLCAYARLAESMAKLADWPDDRKRLVSDPDQGGSLESSANLRPQLFQAVSNYLVTVVETVKRTEKELHNTAVGLNWRQAESTLASWNPLASSGASNQRDAG